MGLKDTVGNFIKRAMRVLTVSHHPRSEEFNMTAKVTGLGMILIGVIGYIITLIFWFMEGTL